MVRQMRVRWLQELLQRPGRVQQEQQRQRLGRWPQTQSRPQLQMLVQKLLVQLQRQVLGLLRRMQGRCQMHLLPHYRTQTQESFARTCLLYLCAATSSSTEGNTPHGRSGQTKLQTIFD